ncbi:MAG: hypothetical protein ACI84B_001773, partial [Oceanospirillaceae bacterium]
DALVMYKWLSTKPISLVTYSDFNYVLKEI